MAVNGVGGLQMMIALNGGNEEGAANDTKGYASTDCHYVKLLFGWLLIIRTLSGGHSNGATPTRRHSLRILLGCS